MKNKKVKVQSYKQIVKTAKRYQEKLAKDISLQNDTIQNFINKTKGFFTKTGELRKNLSAKNKQLLNKLTSDIKEKKLQSLKGIQEYNKQEKIRRQDEKREKSFTEKWLDSELASKKLTDLLKNKLVVRLMNKGYLDIYLLMDIAENTDVDTVTTYEVIEYAIKEMELLTPEELKEELETDEDYILFNEFLRKNKNDFL